jgi:hypothetical protein
MKKLYSFLALALVTIALQAQTETYEFSLTYIGVNPSSNNHQIALVATPNEDVTSQLSSDMAAMVSVPAGYTIGNFSNGTSGIDANEFGIEDNFVPADSGDPAYYVNRLPPTTNINFSFSSGTPIQLVVFEIIGATLPTSGSVSLLPPGDGSRLGFLPDFINMGTDDRYGTQSTTANSIDFTTLSAVTNELSGTSIYPNPVNDVLNIKGLDTELETVSIYSINGQKIMTQTTNLDRINTSTLAQGVYFVQLKSLKAVKTLKIVKN